MHEILWDFKIQTDYQISIIKPDLLFGCARGIMVIVVGNGHSDTSSNPGRDWLHFT